METCDYRKPECSNTGTVRNGRWYCLNHLPEVSSELAAKDAEIEALKAEVERANNSSESYRAGIANLRDRLAQREAEIERLSAPVSDEEWTLRSRVSGFLEEDFFLRVDLDEWIAARLEGK